jgi:hypothetical protein
MHWIIKYARFLLFLVPAVGLAMPAFAQARSPLLNDSEEAGSVIVFPKFIQGEVLVDGVKKPQTEIEVGVVCPNGVTCAENQKVKIRFHWVCGTTEADIAASFVCKETDFDVTTTVFGRLCSTPTALRRRLMGTMTLRLRLVLRPRPSVLEAI